MNLVAARRLLAVSIGIIVTICITTAVALAQGSYVFSMENNVAIRSNPGAQYPIVESVNIGTMLETAGTDSDSDWLYVKANSGKTGWVPKRSITYQKSLSILPDSRKGVADYQVAKEQVAKWWNGQSTSATPICDICSTRVARNTGYLLSTRQVLGSKAYHEMLRAMQPSMYSTAVAQFEKDKTPWLICEKCISQYFVDVRGSADLDELEKGMRADKEQGINILRAVKRQYSVQQVKAKVNENVLWLLEDKERNVIYPITPLMGKELLRLLEAENK